MAQDWPGTIVAESEEAHRSSQATPRHDPRRTIYSVKLRNGHEFEVEGPAGATPEQLHALASEKMAGAEAFSGPLDLTGAVFAPKSTYNAQAAGEYQVHARDPSTGSLGPDETVELNMDRFTAGGLLGDDPAQRTGFHFTPDQEAQIAEAARNGDAGQVVALAQRFGSEHGITITRENAERIARYYSDPAHRGEKQHVDYSQTDAAAEEAARAKRLRGYAGMSEDELRSRDVLNNDADAVLRGAGLGLDDEIDGLLSSLIHGGTVEDNIARARAIKDYDEQNRPIERMAGGFIGSLLLPTKVAKVGRPAAMSAYREALTSGASRTVARSLAQEAARRAIVGQMTKEGTLVGAGIGAAGAEGDIGNRLLGAGGGVALGALTSAGTGVAGARLAAPKTAKPLTEGQETFQAAERLGIEPLAADVGGPMTRRVSAGLAQTPFGVSPITNAATRMLDRASGVLDETARRVGTPMDREAYGEAARLGATKYIRQSASRIGRLYETAAGLAGDTRVVPANARRLLDEQIKRLQEVPGGGTGLGELQAMRLALDSDRFTVQGIRDLRTELYISPELRGTPAERRMRQIVEALSEDVEDSLVGAGKTDAAKAFKAADAQWRQRLKTIDRVIAPIIGKVGDDEVAGVKSGEQIADALSRAAKGHGLRLQRFLEAMPSEERSIVQASMISRLGRATDGQQNAAGDAFSLSTFLTNWSRLSERAKRTLFNDEARAAMNDLAKVAEGSRAAMRFANTSNTGGANSVNLTSGSLGAAVLALITGNPGLAVGLSMPAISQATLSRLLTSPRVVRWVARAPKTTLGRTAYIERLSRIAKAEPALASDILDLQRRLTEAFSGAGPARLAAEEPGNEASGIGQEGQGNEQQYPGEEVPQ